MFNKAIPPAYFRIVKRLPLLLLPLAVLLASSCKKDDQSGVPPVSLDVTINLIFPEYGPLQAPGGWVYLTGGSQGLIVYRNSPDEFTALDRHCPVLPENLCHVTVGQDYIIAEDTTCCHATFLIANGQALTGSGISLRRYNTTFNGTILRIYN